MPNPSPLQKNNVHIMGNLSADNTMIFVHGLGTDQTAWQPIAAEFEATHRIILFDNMGAGATTPDEDFAQHYHSIDRYADDLLDICGYLQIENAVIVGHSVGAMISLLAAIQYPGCFSHLIMIGASPCYLNHPDYSGGFTSADINNIYKAVTHHFDDWVVDFASSAMSNHDKPHLAIYFAQTIRSFQPEFMLTVLSSILNSDFRDRLPSVVTPTLIIQSLNDVFVPLQVATYLNNKIANSELSIINAQGHLPHISAHPAVVDAIKAFLHIPPTLTAPPAAAVRTSCSDSGTPQA